MESAWIPARTRVHSLAIELTAFCNQHCDYCYNAWREDGGVSVGTPAVDKLLARIDRVIDAVSLEHVTITGGEPLASRDLFRVLDHLRARHVRAQMISNGALVTPEIAAKLAKHRLMAVLVTLNGPDAAGHDGLVGGTHFEETLRGIALLREARVPVEGSIVITRRNADRVGETVRLFVSLGVRKIALSRFSPAGYATALARELMPTRQDVTHALEQAVAVGREEKLLLFSTMPIPPCAVERERFPEIDFHDCPIGTAAAGVRARPARRNSALRPASRRDREGRARSLGGRRADFRVWRPTPLSGGFAGILCGLRARVVVRRRLRRGRSMGEGRPRGRPLRRLERERRTTKTSARARGLVLESRAMSYQGRSPINDVVRSVMSAAMLSPAMLVACSTQKNNPEPTTDPTATVATGTATVTATATTPATASATASATSTAVATSTATATATASTPDVMVQPSTRPRGNGKNMPTRGFAGAVRARR